MDANKREFFQCLELFFCFSSSNFYEIAAITVKTTALKTVFHDIRAGFPRLGSNYAEVQGFASLR